MAGKCCHLFFDLCRRRRNFWVLYGVCADFAVTDKGGIEAVCGLYSNGNGALGSGTLNDDVVGDYPNLYVDPMDMQGRAGFAHTVKTGSIEAPTVEVLLPLGFDFIEGTTKPNFWVVKDEYVINNAPSAVVPVFSRVSNYNGTGQVLLKWDFPNLTLPAFGPSNNTTYDHIVEIKINYSARYMATHPLANSISTNTTVRTQNIIAFTGQVRDGLGNPCQEQSCSDSVSIPPNSGSVNSEKYVKGALDVAQSRYPVTGNTELSGDATYEIYVYNHNTENLKQIDIADILPYIGDKDMLSTSNRGSGWSEELTSAITVERFKIGSGLVDASPEVPNGVLYSNTYNACYLDGALPVGQLTASPALASVGQSAGCTDFSGAVAPSGAKGFAFQWANIADPLIFGEYLKVTVNVTQLNGEADRINNEVAWNSFAFTVVEEDDDVLFSSEP